MKFNLHSHFPTDNTIYNAYLKSYKESSGWCSLGIHPWFIPENWENVLTSLLINKNVVAIGECGLDRVCKTDWQLQLDVFRYQIELAERLKKPLIIHCVKAYTECEHLLRYVKVPVIFHGFNRKKVILEQLLKNEHFYISFGERVFLPSLKNTLESCPLNRLFIETDDSQVDIELIYQKVAEIKEVSLCDLEAQVLLNRKKVFDL